MTIRLNNPYILIPFFVTSVFLLFLYVLQINFLTQSAYRIAEQELAIVHLIEANNILKIRGVQTLSFQTLEELAQELSFEKVNRIGYIKILNSAVAQNQ